MQKINAKTLLYGILGCPVRHSFSPLIHNAAFQKLNIDAVYTAFEVQTEDLQSAVNGIRALGIQGLSITIPHKEKILPLLDEVDELAKQIGSVNTVINQNGHLVGTNTDAYGLYRALSEKCSLKDKNIVILGSGGAARAALFSVFYYDNPKTVTIVARNKNTRETLSKYFLEHFPKFKSQVLTRGFQDWKDIKKNVDILIQTTPVGMIPKSNSSLLQPEELPTNKVVMDIVYRPHQTRFLSDAEKKGNTLVYGIDMLLYQGIRQFELWTGKQAPVELMRSTLIQILKGRIQKLPESKKSLL